MKPIIIMNNIPKLTATLCLSVDVVEICKKINKSRATRTPTSRSMWLTKQEINKVKGDIVMSTIEKYIRATIAIFYVEKAIGEGESTYHQNFGQRLTAFKPCLPGQMAQ